MAKTPTVTIVGRINTGKSTLFNVLTESKKALTSPIPGTTRDRNMGKVYWRGYTFRLIDTGGINIDEIKNSIQILLDKKSHKAHEVDTVGHGILKQAYQGISEADLILFIVDGQSGLLRQDKEIIQMLRKTKKPIICACNKMDSTKYYHTLPEFYKLGCGDPFPVSALNGSGTGDLLDIIIQNLKKIKKNYRTSKFQEDGGIAVSLIGKPNVGKSSLVNAITGEERVIVSPIPMTTREPQDITIQYKDKEIKLVDTAGLKRKSKTEPGLDVVSSLQSLSALERSDLVLFVIDIASPITVQDLRLSGMLHNTLASVIIIANKWDTIPDKKPSSDTKFKEYIYGNLNPLKFAPIIFTSAKTGHGVKKILDVILDVHKKRNIQISEKAMNGFLKKILRKKLPYGGMKTNRPRIEKIRQKKTNPPEFIIHMGNDQELHYTYLRYIENELRRSFDLSGVNIKIDSDL